MLEAGQSTRVRLEESLPNYDEDHIAGREDNSLQKYNLVHKFIPMPQAMKVPTAKAAVDQEWEKHGKIPAWDLTKVKNKSEVIDGQGDGVPQGMSITGGGGLVRVPNLRVCKHPIPSGSDPCDSDIPEWLQQFRENLVDDRIPERRDSHVSYSHEVSLESTFKRHAVFGRHSVKSHFPKDRNCEICKRTKITRAPCRIRIGRVVPRAENFGDFITADHKVLSEGCESRNNHRFAVVAQDVASQWIQASASKTKNFSGNSRKLAKVLGAR